MVKVEKSAVAPASLAVEKKKPTGSYREKDVIDQLYEDFHEKCYLCEIDELQSSEVEHLQAHHGGKDRDRMFDWNNLFLSCRHCNGIKNKKKYEDSILNCCTEDPELHINQQLLNGHVLVSPLDEAESSILTAELITECFEQTNTGIRTKNCKVRVDALQRTMNLLYQNLEQYKKSPSPKNLRTLRGMLNRKYKFAGFTRTYVRNHIEDYPDLKEFVAI